MSFGRCPCLALAWIQYPHESDKMVVTQLTDCGLGKWNRGIENRMAFSRTIRHCVFALRSAQCVPTIAKDLDSFWKCEPKWSAIMQTIMNTIMIIYIVNWSQFKIHNKISSDKYHGDIWSGLDLAFASTERLIYFAFIRASKPTQRSAEVSTRRPTNFPWMNNAQSAMGTCPSLLPSYAFGVLLGRR